MHEKKLFSVHFKCRERISKTVIFRRGASLMNSREHYNRYMYKMHIILKIIEKLAKRRF